jgi:hypothetical protein
MLGFTPTASIAVVGEKLGMNSRIGQTSCCGLGQEPFFLGEVTLSNTVDDSMKGFHIRGLPIGSVRVTYVDWCGKCMCRVYQVSLVGCTSI